jgi:type VI secretion system protein ImpK
MDAVNQVTHECFNALTQLRELEGAVGSPDLIHNRLSGFVEKMREKAREQGMPERDATDMAYAIVALCDEIAIDKPEPMHSFWVGKQLQYKFFDDQLAGEGFFNRLQELRRDGRRTDVLRVYYQCLLMGFQGKYSMRGGEAELLKIMDSLRPEVERHIEVPDHLSPNGEAPDEPLIRASKRNPFLWIALGVFAVAIAVFIGLRVSLDRQVAAIGDRVEQLSR